MFEQSFSDMSRELVTLMPAARSLHLSFVWNRLFFFLFLFFYFVEEQPPRFVLNTDFSAMSISAGIQNICSEAFQCLAVDFYFYFSINAFFSFLNKAFVLFLHFFVCFCFRNIFPHPKTHYR